MFTDLPLVSHRARVMIHRARTPTLIKRFNDLNCYRYHLAPKEFGHMGVDGRARQLMDTITCELGYRHMRQVAKSARG